MYKKSYSAKCPSRTENIFKHRSSSMFATSMIPVKVNNCHQYGNVSLVSTKSFLFENSPILSFNILSDYWDVTLLFSSLW